MRGKDKVIAEDKPTLEFLSQLREHRHRAGLRQKDLARLVGVKTGTIMDYEHKRSSPSLRVLMRLAVVLKYDLSGSVNYQYYHKQLNARMLQKQKSRYGFSDLELERLTGYDAALVKRSLDLEATGTLPCLLAVIEVLEREREMRG